MLYTYDDNGIPNDEHCVFLKISQEHKQMVEEVLKAIGVDHKTFTDPGHLFMESEAEFRLRQYFRSLDKTENDRIIAQKAIAKRECVGDLLFQVLGDDGLLDDEYIEQIVKDYFKEK